MSFSEQGFAFLTRLENNNDRAWFKQHQDEYETLLRGPALAFIEQMQQPIQALSPRLTAVARRLEAV